MFVSRHQNIGQSHNTLIADQSFENGKNSNTSTFYS